MHIIALILIEIFVLLTQGVKRIFTGGPRGTLPGPRPLRRTSATDEEPASRPDEKRVSVSGLIHILRCVSVAPPACSSS
jgi:hypothetical protein